MNICGSRGAHSVQIHAGVWIRPSALGKKTPPEVRQGRDVLCKAALFYAGWGSCELCRARLSPLVCHGEAWRDVIKDLYPLGHRRKSTLWSDLAEGLCSFVRGVTCVLWRRLRGTWVWIIQMWTAKMTSHITAAHQVSGSGRQGFRFSLFVQ